MKYIVLFLGLVLLISCQNEVLKNREFNVIDSLLSDNLTDSVLQINYRVPKGFIISDYSKIGITEQKLDSLLLPSLLYKLKILKIFSNDRDGSLILFSSIDSLNNQDHKYLIYNLQEKLTIYKYNDFRIEQFLLKSDKYINIKLLYYSEVKEVKHKFQIDFIIPHQNYNSISKSIESCIGSISKLKN